MCSDVSFKLLSIFTAVAVAAAFAHTWINYTKAIWKNISSSHWHPEQTIVLFGEISSLQLGHFILISASQLTIFKTKWLLLFTSQLPTTTNQADPATFGPLVLESNVNV